MLLWMKMETAQMMFSRALMDLTLTEILVSVVLKTAPNANNLEIISYLLVLSVLMIVSL